jgi:hypothetical protein
MTKTQYKAYLHSPDWQAKRADAIQWYGNICARCEMPRWLAEIAYDQDLHVHHLTYANRGDEDMCDLEVLCRRCHELETFKRTEIREVKAATCESCGDRHWNYRSDRCQFCDVLRINFYASFNRLFQPDVDYGGQPYWISFMKNVVIRMMNEGADHGKIVEIMTKLSQMFVKEYAANMAAISKEIPF